MLDFFKDFFGSFFNTLIDLFTKIFNIICIPIIIINSVVLVLLILYSIYTINYELLVLASLLLFIYVLFFIGVKYDKKYFTIYYTRFNK